MTIGVGGSDAGTELAKLKSVRDTVRPIEVAERRSRTGKAQQLMREQNIGAHGVE